MNLYCFVKSTYLINKTRKKSDNLIGRHCSTLSTTAFDWQYLFFPVLETTKMQFADISKSYDAVHLPKAFWNMCSEHNHFFWMTDGWKICSFFFHPLISLVVNQDSLKTIFSLSISGKKMIGTLGRHLKLFLHILMFITEHLSANIYSCYCKELMYKNIVCRHFKMSKIICLSNFVLQKCVRHTSFWNMNWEKNPLVTLIHA